ncbi:MAG: ImmA/IrrE family metallo-endopeptidase [Candidatus Poribacteria bacterium]|nr:ImmA/IrrE family metallo-endopeptidase [Candidatus Poribacteria bacterium]
MARLIADQGVWVSSLPLPESVSGMFARHGSVGTAILVNDRLHRLRQRFSYAHEYAHALLDSSRSVVVTSDETASNPSELRANAFATELLMPSEGIRELLAAIDKGGSSRKTYSAHSGAKGKIVEGQRRPVAGSQTILPKDAALLARHFSVDYRSAVFQLRNLNHISQRERDALLENEAEGSAYLDLIGAAKDDAMTSGHRELERQVLDLTFEAYRLGEISRGRLLELSKKLRVNGQELIRLAESSKAS